MSYACDSGCVWNPSGCVLRGAAWWTPDRAWWLHEEPECGETGRPFGGDARVHSAASGQTGQQRWWGLHWHSQS